MTNDIHQVSKEEFEKYVSRVTKAINFFRDNHDKLTERQWKSYTMKLCDIVEVMVQALEGWDPDMVEALQEIFPGAKFVENHAKPRPKEVKR